MFWYLSHSSYPLVKFIKVLKAGDSFVSLEGICLLALFKSLLKAAFASLISRKIAALFENIRFTSVIVLAEEEAAELASNRLMPATIRFRSACKSIAATAGEVPNGDNTNARNNKSIFRFMKVPPTFSCTYLNCKPTKGVTDSQMTVKYGHGRLLGSLPEGFALVTTKLHKGHQYSSSSFIIEICSPGGKKSGR